MVSFEGTSRRSKILENTHKFQKLSSHILIANHIVARRHFRIHLDLNTSFYTFYYVLIGIKPIELLETIKKLNIAQVHPMCYSTSLNVTTP